VSGTALVLDNRDSFVFNLVDELEMLGLSVTTLRSGMPLATLQAALDRIRPQLVVLSPGPGVPESAGVMLEWLRTEPMVPVLGVCLGHQALAVAAGGRVSRATRAVHGRSSVVALDEREPIFDGLGPHLRAARYHSLVVTEVPESMKVIATTEEDGERLVMALTHRRLCRIGLQFHPESILTPWGRRVLSRVVEKAKRFSLEDAR